MVGALPFQLTEREVLQNTLRDFEQNARARFELCVLFELYDYSM